MSALVLFCISLNVLSCLACQTQEFTTSSGSITKFNYGPEENCQWVINSPGDIYMRFSQLNTEYSYDIIEIDQGQGTNSVIIGEYSGTAFPLDDIYAADYVTVYFTSDFVIEGTGFQLDWQSTPFPAGPISPCAGDVSLSGSGPWFISSQTPFRGLYASNSVCSWSKTTSQNVLVQFQEFDLEKYFDFVDLSSAGTSTQVASYTGGMIPSAVVLPPGDFVFNFTSDELTARAGFLARIDLISDSTVRPVPNGVCDSVACYCSPPYDDATNCSSVVSPCPACPLFAGSTLSWGACSCQGVGYGPTYESPFCGPSNLFSGDSGNFSHPLSGLTYKPATNCTFTISATGPFSLWLPAMQIHVTDDLWVYEGATAFRLTGRETQPPYNTAGSSVLLRFVSDSVVNTDGTGMTVEWHALSTCPANCSSHGACRNSVCYCDAGWSGTDCATSQGAIQEVPASTDVTLDEPADSWRIYKLTPSGLADIYTVWSDSFALLTS
jgi:hypothetical protein